MVKRLCTQNTHPHKRSSYFSHFFNSQQDLVHSLSPWAQLNTVLVQQCRRLCFHVNCGCRTTVTNTVLLCFAHLRQDTSGKTCTFFIYLSIFRFLGHFGNSILFYSLFIAFIHFLTLLIYFNYIDLIQFLIHILLCRLHNLFLTFQLCCLLFIYFYSLRILDCIFYNVHLFHFMDLCYVFVLI